MQPPAARHWRKNRKLTAGLLVAWFIATFLISGFARELQGITVLGFPLPFYMGAQGALLIYVLLVGYYAWRMGKLDAEYRAGRKDD